MKRIIIFFIVVFAIFPVIANSQTKKETEDWVQYYLSKYFFTTYNHEAMIKITDNYKIYHHPYSYWTYKYTLESPYLLMTTSSYELDSLRIGNLKEMQTTRIDLQKVIKIEYEINNTNEPKYQYLLIRFVFEDGSFDKDGNCVNQAVTISDDIAKRDITDRKSSYRTFIIQSNQEETIKSKIEKRMVKALEHLAKLYGAPIVKDIF